MILRAALLLSLLAGVATAQDRSGDVTGILNRLANAETQLNEAKGNFAQRQALSRAIRAYEAAAKTLSEMHVAVGQEIRARERALVAQQARLRARLGGLARLGLSADAVLVLQGDAPARAARSALVLGGLATDTRSQVEALRTERDALAGLAAEQEALAAQMAETHGQLGGYRDDLIARVEDAQAQAGTLPDIGAEALALATLAIALENALPGPLPSDLPLARASLQRPLEGALLRGFGAADPGGVPRPGLTLAGLPGGLILAPAPATVRFVGQIDGYGMVTVLEPAPGVLLILAGFGTLLAAQGETVAKAAPLGFLPQMPSHGEFSADEAEIAGQPQPKTLYIELRYNQAPVDPTPWFEDLR